MCVRGELYEDTYDTNEAKWSYEVDVSNYQKLDIYRILKLYNITHPCLQHSIKKLLRCGRGLKNEIQDVEEAIITLQRYKGMKWEDNENV